MVLRLVDLAAVEERWYGARAWHACREWIYVGCITFAAQSIAAVGLVWLERVVCNDGLARADDFIPSDPLAVSIWPYEFWPVADNEVSFSRLAVILSTSTIIIGVAAITIIVDFNGGAIAWPTTVACVIAPVVPLHMNASRGAPTGGMCVHPSLEKLNLCPPTNPNAASALSQISLNSTVREGHPHALAIAWPVTVAKSPRAFGDKEWKWDCSVGLAVSSDRAHRVPLAIAFGGVVPEFSNIQLGKESPLPAPCSACRGHWGPGRNATAV